jgi:branched-chain amino acid transport system substrate-binding protein
MSRSVSARRPKRWRTLVTLTALATSTVALAACGGSSGSGASGSSGSSGGTITVGLIAPFSGGYADEGKENQAGAQLAISQINAQGGINGAKLKMVTVDGGTTGGSQALSAAAQLAGDKPAFAIDGPTSALVLPASQVLERASIPQCTDATADNVTTRGFHYIFQMQPKVSAIGQAAVPEFYNVLSLIGSNITKVAVVYDSNPSDVTQGSAFAAALKASGKVQVVDQQEFPLDSTDLSSVAAKIASSGAQVLVPSGTISETEQLLSSVKSSLGHSIPVFNAGSGSPTAESYIASLGSAVNGQFVLTQFDHAIKYSAAQNALLATANTQYKKATGGAFMGELAGEAYVCTWDMAQAVQRAHSTDPAAIRKALIGFAYTSGPGSLEIPGKVEFNSSGANTDATVALSEWCHGDLAAVAPTAEAVAKTQSVAACGG